MIIISGCYPLNTVVDIDKYVLYIDNRKDTTEKSKDFETPNSDRESFGNIGISELHTNQSDIVRVIVNIDLKELNAKYKFYYEYGDLVYCEITESKPSEDLTEKLISIDEIHYFKDGKSLKSYSKIDRLPDDPRAFILSKFYFIDNF